MPSNRTHSPLAKHPARSARVLSTGISIASVLGLTSAYSIAAQQAPSISGNEPIAPALNVDPSAIALVGELTIAPTQPAPATPAPISALTQSAPVGQSAPAVAPITITVLAPNLPATRSSGSK